MTEGGPRPLRCRRVGSPPQGRSPWTATRRSSKTRAAERARKPRPNSRSSTGWALQGGAPELPSDHHTRGNSGQTIRSPSSWGALDDLTGSRAEHAPILRSHVAKLLAKRPQGDTNGQGQQAAPTDSPEPEPRHRCGRLRVVLRCQGKRSGIGGSPTKCSRQVRNELAPLQEEIAPRDNSETRGIIRATQQAATSLRPAL